MLFLKKRISFFKNIFFIIILIVLNAYKVSPKHQSIFGFLSWGVLLIVCLYILQLINSKKWKIETLIIFIFLFPHLKNTFSWHSYSVTSQKNEIRLMNYNVRAFNCYDYLKNNNYNSSKKMFDVISQDSIDILCLQEYYNMDTSIVFNIREKLYKKGFIYSFISIVYTNRHQGQFGIAIFSKFPIINKQEFIFIEKIANRALKATILLPTKDTISLYACHLQSIRLKLNESFSWEKSKKNNFSYQKKLLKRVNNAFVERNRQVDILLKEIKNDSHPILLCGDFNTMPYSYTYHSFANKLSNAFVEKGKGFGFSYNHPHLSFLRIDNQFFDEEKFDLLKFKTCIDIPYSDHFPLYGVYSLKKEKD